MKKPKKAKGPAKLAAQLKVKKAQPSPFELKGRKSHFATIGQRRSGKKTNVMDARKEAFNKVGGPVHVGVAPNAEGRETEPPAPPGGAVCTSHLP
jgi:hypothetical protein